MLSLSQILMKTEWVTFDCYGTLIDWDSGIRRFFSTIPGADDDMLQEWEEIQFRMIQGPYRRYRDILADSLRETLARRGLPAPPEAATAFAESLPTWTPFADTNPALERLKANGIKLGFVSNIDDDLLARTVKHFTVPFDLAVTAEQSGAYKPNAASFRLALSRIGNARVTHVAFGERYDLQTARDCGMQVVFVKRHGRDIPFQSDASIASLKELPGLFE
jgi:2-haloalkanoic acid dehalogenase type II